MNETTPPPLGMPQQTQTSKLAIWSLVLGILAIVLIVICVGPLLFAVPAIICGHIAFSKIKHSGGQLGGSGLAIAGFACGYASLAMIILMLPIAIPNFVKARTTAQKNVCINNLRMISQAKNEWSLENGKTGLDVPTEADLLPYLKDNKFPVCPNGGTYTIGAVTNDPTCSISGHAIPF